MGTKFIPGFNDLATTNPCLALEWDIERNAPITPQEVSPGSHKKYFWLCPEGHSYQTSPTSRSKLQTGCPYCSGTAVLSGFNDLATTNPSLAAEWDFEKNAPLTPKKVSKGSGLKIYWSCASNHSWRATVVSRAGLKRGCPYCAGKAILLGLNDLATTDPSLALEWDIERNAPITPQEVSPGSHKKYFWLCPEGHSYQTSIGTRKRGGGCPYCAGKAILAGYNDLATTQPGVAEAWDYELNAPLTPQEVSAGSDRKFYWLCPSGHSYQAVARSRNTGSCPYCSGKAVLAGFNDLATTNPSLALEWDIERNAPQTPQSVASGSNKKAFWLCPSGHSYIATINDRSGKSSGCPYCSGRAVLAGFNDLATTNPSLALEWDIERNAPLTPQEVSPGSHKKIFWLCPEKHSYRATLADRSTGTGCPKCAKYGYDATQEGLFYFIRSETLRARKVGITNTNRTANRVERYGSDWSVVMTFTHSDGLLIRDLETSILRWLRKDLGLPKYLGKQEMGVSGGHTETFSMEGPNDEEVLQKIEETLTELQSEPGNRQKIKK